MPLIAPQKTAVDAYLEIARRTDLPKTHVPPTRHELLGRLEDIKTTHPGLAGLVDTIESYLDRASGGGGFLDLKQGVQSTAGTYPSGRAGAMGLHPSQLAPMASDRQRVEDENAFRRVCKRVGIDDVDKEINASFDKHARLTLKRLRENSITLAHPGVSKSLDHGVSRALFTRADVDAAIQAGIEKRERTRR